MMTFKLKRYTEEVIDDDHLQISYVYYIDDSAPLEIINTVNVKEQTGIIIQSFVDAIQKLYKEDNFKVIYRNCLFTVKNKSISIINLY